MSVVRTDLGISLEAPKPSSTVLMKLEHAFCVTILCLKCRVLLTLYPALMDTLVISLRLESRCSHLCAHLPETLLMSPLTPLLLKLNQVFAPPETHQAHSFLLAFCVFSTCKVVHTASYCRAELPKSLLFKYYPPFKNQLSLQA